MRPDEALARLRGLGFDERDAQLLFEHFDEAERRGKRGHGYSRIAWLETLATVKPGGEPEQREERPGFRRYDADAVIGYVALRTVVDRELADPPERARLVVVERCFPTGMLGHYVRRLAGGGLVGVLTATSPPRLAHPDGGPKLAGTNPLALGIPSSDGAPVVVDVSMGAVTYGDVLAGLARDDELVPFGGERAHKAFALALGLQLVVDALVSAPGHGAVLLVARPDADPVPALRALADGVRLPGDPPGSAGRP